MAQERGERSRLVPTDVAKRNDGSAAQEPRAHRTDGVAERGLAVRVCPGRDPAKSEEPDAESSKRLHALRLKPARLCFGWRSGSNHTSAGRRPAAAQPEWPSCLFILPQLRKRMRSAGYKRVRSVRNGSTLRTRTWLAVQCGGSNRDRCLDRWEAK